ncbi:dGTP triphosphohydrolase [uncultured Chryseobacterium sp.]|uniref:dGTP triphosphohydrolase n=1 Tax=uncultured Chryseobacterium sp. TaxID=259322 RepID=UPI003748E59D
MNWDKFLNNNRLRQSTGRDPKDARNDFESDFGRIIFSPALRRMHDKTQVFPLTTDDNIHSRLTHSMEVMAIGYSLGVRLCENKSFQKKFDKDKYELFREIPVLLKNSCLIHDIGNPPFGHFGETVIQNYFKDLFKKNIVIDNKEKAASQNGEKMIFILSKEQQNDFINFDGNAQGLRVVTKLQILNDVYGLNLTYATLGSYIKYPNYSLIDESKISKHKIGVFYSEIEYFKKIAEECGLEVDGEIIRHPLCFLMEAADSICYLTIDLEDGYSKNLLSIDDYYNKLKDIPRVKEKLKDIYEDKDNFYKNDMTKIVNFRIHIMQQLVIIAVENFILYLNEIETGNFHEELIFKDAEGLAKALKDLCQDKIFKYREINSLEVTGHSVIKGLLDYYIYFLFHPDKKYRRRASQLISESTLKVAYEENNIDDYSIDKLPDYYKLRVIVDFISGMTDQYALNHYQKISGQKII